MTEKDLIDMGFTPIETDGFKFYEKNIKGVCYLIADNVEGNWIVAIDEIPLAITEASDVKPIIEILNKYK
jgi:hypothetical protein